MHLSRSEMTFTYVISTKLADIEFSSIQRDSRVFNNSKLNNKMKAKKFYLFYCEFKAPLVFYVSFSLHLTILFLLNILMYIAKNNYAQSPILWV